MINYKHYSFMAAVALSILVASCNSTDADEPTSDYDRKTMLTNYVDNLIVPGYTRLQTEVNEMATVVAAFTVTPTAATLTVARKEYQEAYLAWQDVSAFEFGPADDQMLRTNFNIFPTTTSQIESNIASGTYDFQTTANLSAKGFPAIDYLLYGSPTEVAVIEKFTTATQAANRRKYLLDITNLIKQNAETVASGWTTGNTARAFKESGGTAVGSAVGSLVNQLNFEIDLTKRAKVGIPVGKFTAGSPLPEKLEAFYSQTSLTLLERNLHALKAIYLGQSQTGVNGPGLDDYLNHVDAAKKYNGRSLAEAITQQFDAAISAAQALQPPFSQAVATNSQGANKLYDELQKLIILTKTDLPSVLGVTITYTDNDGD